MKTIEIQLYDYNELSDKAKIKALEEHNSDGELYFLEDELKEYLKELLEENNIDGDAELNYSLSYSQGDGVCFMGNFGYKGVNISVVKSDNHYTHKYTTTIEAEADEDDELRNDLIQVIEAEFIEVYREICDSVEKTGYSEIEYQQSEEAFKETCEANDYTFEANGNMRS